MTKQASHSSQLQTWIDRLQHSTTTQQSLIEVEYKDELIRIQKQSQLFYSALCELRTYVHGYSFMDAPEEVLFFRHLKPGLVSKFYFYQSVLDFKLHEPFLLDARNNYLQARLQHLQTFRDQHSVFYGYCLSDETSFDIQYFTRQSAFQNPDLDKNFSTGYDTLYATLLANEELKKYLQHQGQSSDQPDSSSLTWTASKASLIELIYALKASEVFNDGKADLKQIASTLENIFQVSLGNYYRVYQDIRLRKSGQANFLDLLKEKFVTRIQEMD